MSKTLVCTNILDSIDAQVFGSFCNEWFRVGRTTTDEFIMFHPNRLSIDNARNRAAQLALQYECDYLYFIDDDMLLSPNTYTSLKSANADVAQALTFIRGYPFHCMAFKKSEKNGGLDYYNDYTEDINENGLVEAEAVGFSCVLIKTDVLKTVNAPYFVTSAQTTEDVYFCLKLRNKFESNVKIVVDTRVPTMHMLLPEAVGYPNLLEMKKFYAPRESNGSKDRGKEYLEQCKQQLMITESD